MVIMMSEGHVLLQQLRTVQSHRMWMLRPLGSMPSVFNGNKGKPWGTHRCEFGYSLAHNHSGRPKTYSLREHASLCQHVALFLDVDMHSDAVHEQVVAVRQVKVEAGRVLGADAANHHVGAGVHHYQLGSLGALGLLVEQPQQPPVPALAQRNMGASVLSAHITGSHLLKRVGVMRQCTAPQYLSIHRAAAFNSEVCAVLKLPKVLVLLGRDGPVCGST